MVDYFELISNQRITRIPKRDHWETDKGGVGVRAFMRFVANHYLLLFPFPLHK